MRIPTTMWQTNRRGIGVLLYGYIYTPNAEQ
jgi:hypothetical protein